MHKTLLENIKINLDLSYIDQEEIQDVLENYWDEDDIFLMMQELNTYGTIKMQMREAFSLLELFYEGNLSEIQGHLLCSEVMRG